jgi:hypothetical protein
MQVSENAEHLMANARTEDPYPVNPRANAKKKTSGRYEVAKSPNKCKYIPQYAF